MSLRETVGVILDTIAVPLRKTVVRRTSQLATSPLLDCVSGSISFLGARFVPTPHLSTPYE